MKGAAAALALAVALRSVSASVVQCAHAQRAGIGDRASLTVPLRLRRQLYCRRPDLECHSRLGDLRQHADQQAEPDQHRRQYFHLQRAPLPLP